MKTSAATIPRRSLVLGALGGGALSLSSFSQLAFAADLKFVNVLTGGQSGVYYPMGVALSQIWGRVLPDAKVTVQSTKASAENLNLLQAGRGEMALVLGDALSDAWKGDKESGFAKPLDKLRAVSGMYANYIQIVASGESGIKTLADLKGKRISVGAPKSGTELNARAVFRGAGMTYDDFSKVEYLPFGESVELMKNRQFDATLQSAGLGVSSIRDLATSVPIQVVPIPPEVAQKINDAAYQPAMIPANTYPGQTAETQTIAIKNFLVSHSGVPADAVYADDQGDVREPGHAGGRAQRGQGHQEGRRRHGHAGAVPSGCREVLQRSRTDEVSAVSQQHGHTRPAERRRRHARRRARPAQRVLIPPRASAMGRRPNSTRRRSSARCSGSRLSSRRSRSSRPRSARCRVRSCARCTSAFCCC